jgi:hypothetical protein
MTDLNLDELERDTRAVIERLPAGAEMSIEQETLLALIAAARDGERMRGELKKQHHEEVAAILLAVGGEVRVSKDDLVDACGKQIVVDDHSDGFITLRIRKEGHASDCELALALKGGEG